jgi:ABC-type histidine transport system ATPase subunit
MAEATPALEIRNLHKRYGDLEVLKGISLTAKDGDVISILGSSGSGKSTFLRCINLLENPHQGQIFVAGEELKLKAAKKKAEALSNTDGMSEKEKLKAISKVPTLSAAYERFAIFHFCLDSTASHASASSPDSHASAPPPKAAHWKRCIRSATPMTA